MISVKDIKIVDGWRHVTQSVNHITIQMYISRKCNYKCSYCTHRDNSETYKTFEEYIDLMDMLYESVKTKDVIDFSFFGGEPTIIPRFNEILDHILNKYPNTYVTITSNGSQPLKWWKQLEKWTGRIHCFMSYQYAFTKSLDEYMEKMIWLYDHNFLYYLAVMLENENEYDVIKSIKTLLGNDKLATKLTYASIDFNFNEKYNSIKDLFGRMDYNVLQEQDYALKITLLNGDDIYYNDHMLFKTHGLHHFKYFRCLVGKEHILLDSNGDIYMCLSHILSDVKPLGNVYKDKDKIKELSESNGQICLFDECVSELWIKKERIINI